MTNKLDKSITALRGNIDERRKNLLKETRALSHLDNELNFLQEILVVYPLDSTTSKYQDLNNYVTDYSKEMLGYSTQFAGVERAIYRGGTILTSASSIIAETHPQSVTQIVPKIDKLRSTRDLRQEVYEKLRQHNAVVADMFISAWETLETPAKDPTRGPAFLMRETLVQFLHHFAPNELVKSKDWYKPFDEKTDITMYYRTRVIIEDYISPEDQNELIKADLKNFRLLYTKLNDAHCHQVVDENKIKLLLFEAQDLLNNIISVINK